MKSKGTRDTIKGGISRREFLSKAAGAGAAFTIVPRYVLGGVGNVAPSERINIAIIGTGGQGIVNMKGLMQQEDVQIPVICDVNEESDYSRFYFQGTAGSKPAYKLVMEHNKQTGNKKDCKVYVDFRKMFEKENNNIDAVLVATPDHMHALPTMAAIKAGKGVYCEKPLAHSIYETRKITEAAREAGVATQMGNMGHSSEGMRMTCEWIWDGAIGDDRELQLWTNVGALAWTNLEKEAAPAQPVPKGLNWDLWLGPAKKRPYNIAYAPYNWRGWWDFGTGALGDLGCHIIDPAFWALDLSKPESVEGHCASLTDETVPVAGVYYYKYPARGNMPPLTMTWHDGGLRPAKPDELEPGRRIGGKEGIMFIGDKGTILSGGWTGAPRIIPEAKMKAYKLPPKTLPRSKGFHRDWLDACKGGEPASANFDYGGPLTEIVLLGNVALRTGEKLYWDAENMKATNCDKADEYIKPEFREGWSL